MSELTVCRLHDATNFSPTAKHMTRSVKTEIFDQNLQRRCRDLRTGKRLSPNFRHTNLNLLNRFSDSFVCSFKKVHSTLSLLFCLRMLLQMLLQMLLRMLLQMLLRILLRTPDRRTFNRSPLYQRAPIKVPNNPRFLSNKCHLLSCAVKHSSRCSILLNYF